MGTDSTPESKHDPLIKLPKGTIVSSEPLKAESDEDKASTATKTVNNGETSDIKDEDDLKLPPGLVISPEKPAANSTETTEAETESSLETDSAPSGKVENDKGVETLGSPKTEIVPSPASDATTSTKDTVTPSKAALVMSKGKKPTMPRLVPRQETSKDGGKSQKDEKTSTVKTSRIVDETQVSNNGKTRQSKRDSDNENDTESMTSLDMENEELDDDEEESNEYGIKKSVVKLSKILPQPVNVKSRNSTPASSSRKGMQSKTITKAGDKRKRSEEQSLGGISKLSKKAKLSEEEDNPGTPEQGTDLLTGTSSSGRVRRVKKIFDL